MQINEYFMPEKKLGRDDEDVLQFLTVPNTEPWFLLKTKLPILVSARKRKWAKICRFGGRKRNSVGL